MQAATFVSLVRDTQLPKYRLELEECKSVADCVFWRRRLINGLQQAKLFGEDNVVGPQDGPDDGVSELSSFPTKLAQAAHEMADTNRRVETEIKAEIGKLTSKIGSFKTFMQEM